MINLTLFGTTTGLEVLHLPIGANSLPIKFEDTWIEISPSIATLRPDKDVVVLNRRQINQHVATWIAVYRPIREIGYDRPGSFYGAGAWIVDHVIDVTSLLDTLNNLANQIRSLAIEGDRFVKRLIDIRSQLAPPDQIAKLSASLSPLVTGCSPSGENIFITANNSSVEVLEWGQRAQSASEFSKIIIGNSDQAPSSVSSSSMQVFRTLAHAIEGAYQKSYADHQNVHLQYKSNIQQFEKQLAKLKNERAEIDHKLAAHDMELLQAESRTNKWMKECQDLGRENTQLINQITHYQRGANLDSSPRKVVQSSDKTSDWKPIPIEDDSWTANDYISWGIVFLSIILALFIGSKFLPTEKNCAFLNLGCSSSNKPPKNSSLEQEKEINTTLTNQIESQTNSNGSK